MEVWSSVMGPERVLPSSEDELGENERPAEGALMPGVAVWSGGDGEEEEEVEEVNSGGYYYQPLNQDPDGANGAELPEDEDEDGGTEQDEAPSHAEQLQQVQHRIEVSHVTTYGWTKYQKHLSVPHRPETGLFQDHNHVELVKRTMAAVALPSLGVPAWAQEISDDQWKDMVQHTLQSRQSAGALRLSRRGNISGP
uniref:Male-enhanced antigen 1 n=1 Tax=Mastacembelus armatus TaxID=205130 RepID=A0A3Q3NC47_9TELE